MVHIGIGMNKSTIPCTVRLMLLIKLIILEFNLVQVEQTVETIIKRKKNQ